MEFVGNGSDMNNINGDGAVTLLGSETEVCMGSDSASCFYCTHFKYYGGYPKVNGEVYLRRTGQSS